MQGYQDYKVMLYEIVNGIATVKINRPESLNAINSQVLTETTHMFKQFAHDPEVKVVIVSSLNENLFAAGADIREMVEYSSLEAENFDLLVHETINSIYHLPKPTIAAVAGLALGGGLETVLACDIRIAADNAVFGALEINLGVIPGGAGTQMLTKVVGPAKAKELVFSGETIDAETALKIGLVNKVVPLQDLMPEAEKAARRFARKPPLALKAAKELINNTSDIERATLMLQEKKYFSALFDTNDQREGMTAFMDNRRPNFQGN